MKKYLSFLLVLLLPAFALAAVAVQLTAWSNSALLNSATLVQGRGGYLNWYNVANSNAATVYVQFFDKATAGAVTVGTTAPLFWIAVPGGSPGGVTDGPMLQGLTFQNGIVVAVTTTPTGGSAPATAVPISLGTQ